MELKIFNNKRVSLSTVDDEKFEGLAIFNGKDDYDQNNDALSIKQEIGWVIIFEDEIKAIEIMKN